MIQCKHALFILLSSAIIANAQAPSKAPAKAAPKAAAKAAQPPKPGLASCAGKIEGRYAASNGTPYTIEFRSGKATVNVPVLGPQDTTCWIADKKIYLYIEKDPDP